MIWFVAMIVGFAGSALFSGLETGAYSLNRVRLQVLDHRGDTRARRLRRALDNPTALLTTLLIGNNIANQLGTASLTAILEARGLTTVQILLFTTLIVTPALFVFGETLPKDLFAVHADRLMYRLAPLLTAAQRVLTWTGLVPLIGLFTGLLMRALGGRGAALALHPRRRVEALVSEGVGHGLLSDDQSAIVRRVMDLSSRTVADEMVPWKRVLTVRIDTAAPALWELADRTGRSRFPVLDERRQVVGVLDIDKVLQHDPEACPPVRDLMGPVHRFPETERWRSALSRMQREHVAMAIVVDAQQRPRGIVTIKDLVEPVTGELWSW